MKTKLILLLLIAAACSKPDQTITGEPQHYQSTPVNLMPNGGGNCTTDWEGENIALYWVEGTGEATICNGIHWDGAYQRIERAVGQFVLLSPGTPDDGKSYHTLTLKYRADTKVWIAVMYSGRCTYILSTLPIQNKPTYVSFYFWSPRIYTIKFYNSPCFPGFLELDEVNVW